MTPTDEVTITFPRENAESLLKLINSALKVNGIVAAKAALYFDNLILEALKSSVKKEQ